MKEQKTAQMLEVEESEVKNFKNADQVREFPQGRAELVKIGGTIVSRLTLQPGWRWSESLGPIFKTDRCDATHMMYYLSGRVRIRMEDGHEFECQAGDVCLIPAGHDAWVVGDEPVQVVDFLGGSMFAESEESGY